MRAHRDVHCIFVVVVVGVAIVVGVATVALTALTVSITIDGATVAGRVPVRLAVAVAKALGESTATTVDRAAAHVCRLPDLKRSHRSQSPHALAGDGSSEDSKRTTPPCAIPAT